MEYKLSEQELKDLMHRSWLKAKNFYKGQEDEYFYDYFESEKKQLTIHSVVFSEAELKSNEALSFKEWLSHFEKTEDDCYWFNKEVLYCKEEMKLHYDELPDE